MKKWFTIALTILCLAATTTPAHAKNACIYGSAVNSDGSKIDGTATVSTSWNSKKAYPRNGKYRLCLGSVPNARITIYLNGQRYAEIYVDGDTRLDIRRK